MAERRAPEFFVINVPADVLREKHGIEEDRFVIAETATFVSAFPRPFSPGATTGERLAAMQRALDALPLLTEADVRAQLAARGLESDAIDGWLARARRAGSLPASAFAADHITKIGYRNPDGQEVIRKTDRRGPDNQRVFVLRCHVCGHEYGAYGCDADIRRCPACQDGPPALTVDTATFDVRRARVSDADAMAVAHLDSIDSIGPAYYDPELVRLWGAGVSGSMFVNAMARGEVFYIAVGNTGDTREVLGFSSHNRAGDQHRTAVYVRGSAARRGIGSALFRAAEADAVAAGAASIHVDSSLAAVDFYKAHGFEEIGRGDHQFASGRVMPCVFMRKALQAR